MTTIVFVGPTLRRKVWPSSLEVAGPAGRGDVLRAMRAGFENIAIIDGYFDQTLPVWHKEILYALSRGHNVWGAASMGALRAAELSAYGMHGIGRVFEAFRDGLLEDDDEVAIAHASAEASFRPLSEALVNIRVTLRRAVVEGAIASCSAVQYIELARSCFYPERSFPRLLELAQASPALAHTTSALREWLTPSLQRRVDQKAQDAEELLEALAANAVVPPSVAGFVFAHTDGFQQLIDQLHDEHSQL